MIRIHDIDHLMAGITSACLAQNPIGGLNQIPNLTPKSYLTYRYLNFKRILF